MSDIVTPITVDGLVGFDQFQQLIVKIPRGEFTDVYMIADVRGMTCAICNHGWQPTAKSMEDQYHWRLVEGYVHQSCIARYVGLTERADFHHALVESRMRFAKLFPIANGYWPKSIFWSAKPWYRAELLDYPAAIVIGSRKRVISIELMAVRGNEDLEWWQRAKDEFDNEDVTKVFQPRRVLLHAWTNEKLDDYLKRLAKVSGYDVRKETE